MTSVKTGQDHLASLRDGRDVFLASYPTPGSSARKAAAAERSGGVRITTSRRPTRKVDAAP